MAEDPRIVRKNLKQKLFIKDLDFLSKENAFGHFKDIVNFLIEYFEQKDKKEFKSKSSTHKIICQNVYKNKKGEKHPCKKKITLNETITFNKKKKKFIIRKIGHYYLHKNKKICQSCYQNMFDIKRVYNKKSIILFKKLLIDNKKLPEDWNIDTLVRGALKRACDEYISHLKRKNKRFKELNQLRLDIHKLGEGINDLTNFWFEQRKEPEIGVCSACKKEAEIRWFSQPIQKWTKKRLIPEQICDDCNKKRMQKIRIRRKINKLKKVYEIKVPKLKKLGRITIFFDRQGIIELKERGNQIFVLMHNPIQKEKEAHQIRTRLAKKMSKKKRYDLIKAGKKIEAFAPNIYQLEILKKLNETGELVKVRPSMIIEQKKIKGKMINVVYALLPFRHIQKNKIPITSKGNLKKEGIAFLIKNIGKLYFAEIIYNDTIPYFEIYVFKHNKLIQKISEEEIFKNIKENDKKFYLNFRNLIKKYRNKRKRLSEKISSNHNFWMCGKKREDKILKDCNILQTYSDIFKRLKRYSISKERMKELKKKDPKTTYENVLRSLQSEFSIKALQNKDFFEKIGKDYVKNFIKDKEARGLLRRLNEYRFYKSTTAKKRWHKKSKKEKGFSNNYCKLVSYYITKAITDYVKKNKINKDHFIMLSKKETNLMIGTSSKVISNIIPKARIKSNLMNNLAFQDINYFERTDKEQNYIDCYNKIDDPDKPKTELCMHRQKETDADKKREFMSLFAEKINPNNKGRIICQKCGKFISINEAEAVNLNKTVTDEVNLKEQLKQIKKKEKI